MLSEIVEPLLTATGIGLDLFVLFAVGFTIFVACKRLAAIAKRQLRSRASKAPSDGAARDSDVATTAAHSNTAA